MFESQNKFSFENDSHITKEKIIEIFSEENIKSLELDDYILVLKDFPGAMLAHSVRQGVRDHSSSDQFGWEFHNSGKGKVHNGFVNILKDGYLKSPLVASLGENITSESVKAYLNLDQFNTEKEALNYLNNTILKNTIGGWDDRSAIHFASDFVPNKYYGAEKENEIFIIFPSIFIASQQNFGYGDLADGRESEENNQWVFTKDDKGLNINTGIIFIPSDAKVDSLTGSRYKINEKGLPVLKDDVLQLSSNTVSSKDFWELYFKKNPSLKPSKIVYYEGSDPTAALKEWKSKNNLTKEPDDKYLNFEENVVKHSTNKTYREKFIEIANKVIDEYFK
jgi:hypothetical protein